MVKLQSVNPSNYQVLGEIEISDQAEIAEKVRLAKTAQKEWKDIGLEKRVELLRNAIGELNAKMAEITLMESREMGMPINEAVEDFNGNVDFANWYFDHAGRYLSPEITFANDLETHRVYYEPMGVSAVIIPWNFPFGNFIWGTMQNLIAGNTVVLKHSEECPISGKLFEDVFVKHLPKGVFNEVYGGGETGKLLVQQNINMIVFTGNTKTGRSIYEIAGQKFIKTVMELGGSAPGIIFREADIKPAVENVCYYRLYNAGQCCDGLKRLIVHEDIYDKVVERIASIFSAKTIGIAEDKNTEIGPLAAKRQLELLISQVEDSKQKGAKIITGGSSLEAKLGGAFFEPTVLTGITRDMRVWKEEVFGPVLPVVKFRTEQEAVELANQTSYGLGAYVYTQDDKQAERVAGLIETGMVSVNGTNYTMPFNPFGGFKNSGIGREHGKYGFREITQIKIVAKGN